MNRVDFSGSIPHAKSVAAVFKDSSCGDGSFAKLSISGSSYSSNLVPTYF
jgi:hypothetical protein